MKKALQSLEKEYAEKIIGQKVVSAEIDDLDAIVLTFSNGAVLRAGVACGNTPWDSPYFSYHVECSSASR